MPLLKRRAFRRASASELLRDDDEVFHCEITDEIFKDYEEYCERIILVNSMVWSCEMTGKPNLTYAEALDSERNARKSLRDFPMELRTPLLYLANRTKRSSLADMLEDVFNFVRDRYFVGETVEACLEGDSWAEAHVLSVTAPKHLTPADAASPVKPSTLYSYEVEQWDEQDAGASGQMGTAPSDRVRRRKGVFTREKNKLFIKQFVEQTPAGLFVVKKSALDKYNIHKVKFEQLFCGAPPQFPSSKKFLKSSLSPNQKPPVTKPAPASKAGKLKKNTPDKKQQSIAKFVTKTEKFEGPKPVKAAEAKAKAAPAGPSLKAEMARAGATLQQRKLDEKERKKERKAKLAAYIKEWHRQKDDLDLEDHKVLPKATPVEVEGIPSRHLGDFLAVLEFVHLYADTLKTKDVFHNGLDIEILRRSLTQKESAGIFSDIVQMLLTTVFSLQEEESEEVNESGSIQESTGNIDVKAGTGVAKAVELATKASKWPQTYLATPLSKLPLDAYTVSEVLRLHLLSSGATAGERCARWRYQQRGGYSSLDDAGLHLRLAHPHVIRSLACTHVADLPLDDKFRILQCLMNQILSYATVRDVIEEKLESQRTIKYEIKMMQAAERKREAELAAARIKLNKEARAQREGAAAPAGGEGGAGSVGELRDALDALEKEHEQKKAEHEKKVKELQAQCFDYQSYLGMDRAYRGYWLNQSVPGLFVELGDTYCGPCRERPVLPVAPPTDTLQYVQKLFESERGASDKENDSANTSRNGSPKKQPGLNGLSAKLSALEATTQRMRELLMCTGEGGACPVHGAAGRPRWAVYHEGRQVEELLAALNRRGLRELDLKNNLEVDKKSIVEYIEKCPIHMLNPEFQPPVQPNTTTRAKKLPTSSITIPADTSLSEALEISLRDYILELEEKVFHGHLGALKVKDREAWRGTILLRSYDKQADYLTWGPNQQYRDDYHLPNGRIMAPQVKDKESGEDIKPVLNNYRDPGTYLEETGLAVWAGRSAAPPLNDSRVAAVLNDVKIINGGINGTLVSPKDVKPLEGKLSPVEPVAEPEQQQAVVRGLASALLQISQAINHKYLKRPLGYDEKERKDHEAKGKPLDFRALQRWEVSLMECRSFAQVALHLLTLDSSVTWSASILNASCKLCRRKTDGDNMLLCDGCNKGHHMYCLKPKLTKVPEGDWFCEQCKPKEKTPRKKRRLFNDNVQEEPEEEDEAVALGDGVCGECGSGGRLSASCAACGGRWHAECAQPRPPRGAPRPWKCAVCLLTNRREHGVRRCAADSMNNIHHYTRILNNDDSRLTDIDSDCSEDNVVLLKIKGRRVRSSKESSPAALSNGHAPSSGKRSRKSHEESAPPAKKSRGSGASTPLSNGHGGGSKYKKSMDEPSNSRKSKSSAPSTPLTNGHHEGGKSSARASKGKRGSRAGALSTDSLQELLRDVMRHRDAWPFCEPVSVEEVPDYLSVVEEPMDFQTMSDKLSAGEYGSDALAMRDVALVFHNCYLYNQDTHPVARAGARLEKFFMKRCAELELPPLPDLTQSAKTKRSKTEK